MSLGDRRGRGADSGRWLAGAVAGGCIATSAGSAGAGCGAAGAGAEEEEESTVGAAAAGGGGRGLARPAGRYPRGGRDVSGGGTGSGRSGAVNLAGFA